MTHLTASKLREGISDAINRVAFRGERIVLRRNKKDVLALIPLEDLALLQALEDLVDLQELRRAKQEFLASGGKAIPLAQVAKELGIALPKSRRR